MKSIKSIFASAIAFATVTSVAGVASAGYVCSVRTGYNSTAYGFSGSVYYTEYSLPDCQGSYLGSRYICSSGATTSVCTSSSIYQQNSTQLQSLYLGLVEAAVHNTEITSYTTSACNSSGSSCWALLYIGS